MRPPPDIPRQRGGVAGLLLVVLIAAIALIGIGERLTGDAALLRERTTAAALARAVEALAGYGATYRDAHPAEVFGYLPCPDRDGDGDADSPCEGADKAAVGRLPYKTLGLPAIRDGSGECLWYAVSGAFKNSPKSLTTALNWDTVGQFRVTGFRGGTLAGAGDGAGGAAAVVFAPGPALAANAPRPAGGECGGSSAYAAYLETGTSFPAVAPIVSLTAGRPGDAAANDRLAWVSPADLFFRRIRHRSDFQGHLNELLETLRNCLQAGPLPAPIALGGMQSPPGRRSGRLPADPCYAAETSPPSNYFHHYAELVFYVVCDPQTPCLRVNATPCTGVLLFAGERTGDQQRLTSTDRSDPANYLEAPNLSAFTDGGDFGGPVHFAVATPDAPASADVVVCLQGPP